MTEDNAPLTPARFAALADIYGGTIARWPRTLQADARRLAATDPAMRAILTEADRLDALLDCWHVPLPSAALRQSIEMSRRRSLARRARLWWTGLGLATALAGAATGSIAAAATILSGHAPAAESTLFGEITWQEM